MVLKLCLERLLILQNNNLIKHPQRLPLCSLSEKHLDLGQQAALNSIMS